MERSRPTASRPSALRSWLLSRSSSSGALHRDMRLRGCARARESVSACVCTRACLRVRARMCACVHACVVRMRARARVWARASVHRRTRMCALHAAVGVPFHTQACARAWAVIVPCAEWDCRGEKCQAPRQDIHGEVERTPTIQPKSVG